MNLKGKIVAITAWVLMCGGAMMASAQSSLNAYSPYTFYGVGDIHQEGNAAIRAMGGAGIGFRNYLYVNTLNPASYSSVRSNSFLSNYDMEGQNFYARTTDAKTSHNTFNIRDISMSFPLAKGLGTSISVSPYSSVGYKVRTTDEDPNNWANIGRVQYGYEGTGDITEVKVSVGWAPWQKFSIGVAAKYYWGYIERKYQAEAKDVVTGS